MRKRKKEERKRKKDERKRKKKHTWPITIFQSVLASSPDDGWAIR